MPDAVPPPPAPPGTPWAAARAAWIGSALEYYDFFIYGTAAALVFGKVFFPASDPAAGTLASLATFGVGYAARPIGAIALGHLGDRHGRRKVLLTTVIAMGTAPIGRAAYPTPNVPARPGFRRQGRWPGRTPYRTPVRRPFRR